MKLYWKKVRQLKGTSNIAKYLSKPVFEILADIDFHIYLCEASCEDGDTYEYLDIEVDVEEKAV